MRTGRAYFNLHNRPAFLQIDPIKLEDAGDYRCRVDFKKARTVNTVISLKVIGEQHFKNAKKKKFFCLFFSLCEIAQFRRKNRKFEVRTVRRCADWWARTRKEVHLNSRVRHTAVSLVRRLPGGEITRCSTIRSNTTTKTVHVTCSN